ncbi:solute carrier family 39 (zinc transporter), member 1/2/3, partial [Tremellales sp. Uapishka_1]
MSDTDACSISNDTSRFGLRIASIFVILVRSGLFPPICTARLTDGHPSRQATSLVGTLAPIVLRQSSFVPRSVFEFAKYFGSGVIIATAFIHLLAPAFEELGSECLTGVWQDYSWAPAIAMVAVYSIFFAEIAAYRMGTKRMEKIGFNYSSHNDDATDAHAHSHAKDPPLAVDTSGPSHPHHGHPSHPDAAADPHAPHRGHVHDHGESLSSTPGSEDKEKLDLEVGGEMETVNGLPSRAEATAQLIAVAVLEFGVMLHSVIIGLTLAVNESFVILFVVIVFHQMFEGLGLGSRLSGLTLPDRLSYSRYVAAGVYAICTPVGVAVGLGIRETYNGNGATANIVSGVLDAFSAGVLLYTGLVELLGHELLFSPRIMKSSTPKLAYILGCMTLGSGLMALLGRWA